MYVSVLRVSNTSSYQNQADVSFTEDVHSGEDGSSLLVPVPVNRSEFQCAIGDLVPRRSAGLLCYSGLLLSAKPIRRVQLGGGRMSWTVNL